MKNVNDLCLGFAALALFTPGVGWANLVVNGNFADYTITTADRPIGNIHHPGTIAGYQFFGPPSIASNTDIFGWTISGQNGIRPNSVAVTDAPPYSDLAFGGATTFLDLEGSGGKSGVIGQTFYTERNHTYALSFAYANNPDSNNTPGALVRIFAGTSDYLTDSITHSGSTLSDLNWVLYSKEFTTDSVVTSLLFEATTNSGYSILLDAVSVVDITPPPPPPPSLTPEPSTILLVSSVVSAATAGWRRRLALLHPDRLALAQGRRKEP